MNAVISEIGRKFLRLHLASGVGPVRLRKLIEHFGNIDAVLAASAGALQRVDGLGPKVAEAIWQAHDAAAVELDIENEIDRYISWPGQALAYKLGELRILEMRRDAEKKLGEKFNLRAFHDALLSGGAMPIDVLERRMRDWLGAQ